MVKRSKPLICVEDIVIAREVGEYFMLHNYSSLLFLHIACAFVICERMFCGQQSNGIVGMQSLTTRPRSFLTFDQNESSGHRLLWVHPSLLTVCFTPGTEA